MGGYVGDSGLHAKMDLGYLVNKRNQGVKLIRVLDPEIVLCDEHLHRVGWL